VTERPDTPEGGIAAAVSDLSDQTRLLVRREIDAAVQEMWTKAKRSAPAVVLTGASAGLLLLSAACAYQFSLRLLERRLSPASAAMAAAAAYGAAGAFTGVLGIRQLRNAQLPLPTRTMQQTTAAVTDTAT
jgi:Putative Actinobacterial Holin-X, holin superfamily III